MGYLTNIIHRWSEVVYDTTISRCNGSMSLGWNSRSFITMTSNPRWPEIERHVQTLTLLHGIRGFAPTNPGKVHRQLKHAALS
ncbi:hypothetical protein OSB04_016920 [Centaurea solstitialis]|uniref:Uncharacterized protein n=1 Tax=Centaurea solstitialis TaxID=347529 RepID=A0AA38WHX3_9ASTR|nr:hypothetical protein OSB04_016920 [Centaurea solstitialis]